MILTNVKTPWGETYAEVEVVFGEYRPHGEYGTGHVAIQLFTDGELLATPTVNLFPSHGAIPGPGHVHIKNYSEGVGMAELLAKHGVIEPFADDAHLLFGPFDSGAVVGRLTPEALAEVPERHRP